MASASDTAEDGLRGWRQSCGRWGEGPETWKGCPAKERDPRDRRVQVMRDLSTRRVHPLLAEWQAAASLGAAFALPVPRLLSSTYPSSPSPVEIIRIQQLLLDMSSRQNKPTRKPSASAARPQAIRFEGRDDAPPPTKKIKTKPLMSVSTNQ